MTHSDALLHYFSDSYQELYGKSFFLKLRPTYKEALASLGHPERNLPPTIHIAGTNGKGSTGAYLRAILEAAGKKVHASTSPHLISFRERIRVAGKLIDEEELCSLLQEIKDKTKPGDVSYFEAATVAALAAFARTPADVVLLEVGLGGRLDATNIIPKSIASVITRLSYDHRDYLGKSMKEIAQEKAGIMRQKTPCYSAAQPSAEAVTALHEAADDKDVPLSMAGIEWNTTEHPDGSFDFTSVQKTYRRLPKPALTGAHQIQNAGLAIATLNALPFDISEEAIRTGLTYVYWPGRLQQLTSGALYDQLPLGSELWVDGGHNDSAGQAIATEIQKWEKPIDLVFGMLSTKNIEEYITPLLPHVRSIRTIGINNGMASYTAEELEKAIQSLGYKAVKAAPSLSEALHFSNEAPTRMLICGSLSLVGLALKENGTEIT